MITTESEAWAMVEVMLKCGGMPPFHSYKGECTERLCPGLCAIVWSGHHVGLWTEAVAEAMSQRVYRALRPGEVFLAPPGEVRPRIKYARQFRDAAAREEASHE